MCVRTGTQGSSCFGAWSGWWTSRLGQAQIPTLLFFSWRACSCLRWRSELWRTQLPSTTTGKDYTFQTYHFLHLLHVRKRHAWQLGLKALVMVASRVLGARVRILRILKRVSPSLLLLLTRGHELTTSHSEVDTLWDTRVRERAFGGVRRGLQFHLALLLFQWSYHSCHLFHL